LDRPSIAGDVYYLLKLISERWQKSEYRWSGLTENPDVVDRERIKRAVEIQKEQEAEEGELEIRIPESMTRPHEHLTPKRTPEMRSMFPEIYKLIT
jgi:hypothetical protein